MTVFWVRVLARYAVKRCYGLGLIAVWWSRLCAIVRLDVPFVMYLYAFGALCAMLGAFEIIIVIVIMTYPLAFQRPL